MTSFYCSKCKVSHPGNCPPAPKQVTIDPSEDGAIDFDCLVDEYTQLPKDELEQHYLAAKQALLKKLAS